MSHEFIEVLVVHETYFSYNWKKMMVKVIFFFILGSEELFLNFLKY